jgi:anti-anti-sigma factor
MSTAETPGSGWTTGMDAESSPPPWENHTSRFTAHWGPSVVVVTAHGELDAANAVALADYVQRCAAYCERVILDLTKLTFFGTSGFSVLHTINVRCAGADVQWTVVPNHVVTRLLRLCDPDHALPVCDSVTGDSTGRDDPRRLLQLVPQPR